ncbi:MAG TPA: AbrB/MazE/SpoVT family DNA-binding domain-containing protein [Hyphomonas sp.]|nr:AbrB/MazE/SpoVT family DNA-binding domain-containing protein [Hyphomonas sp.]
MTTLTITGKGQVTLKKEVLTHLGVRPGEKVAVELLPDGRVEVRAEQPRGPISGVFGALNDPARTPLSIEDINAIIEQGWADRR